MRSMNRFDLARALVLGVFGVLVAPAAPLARPGADISVEAVARDTAVEVTAHAVVRAPADLIWRTLTDYDHLAQFVPGISSSRVVSRAGSQSIVEQMGGARLWIFSYPIRVTVYSNERPYQGIDVHLLRGNLRRLDGGYQIVARSDGSTELTWSGLIEPDRPLPVFIRTALLRLSISDQFAGMVREIERRAASLAAGRALLAP